MGEPTPHNEEAKYLVVQQGGGKFSPMAILVIAQMLVMVGIGVWAVTAFQNDKSDAKKDGDGNIVITKDDYDALLKKAQNPSAPVNEALPAPLTGSGELHVVSVLPVGISGSQAQLQWHSDGFDYFALSGILIVEGRNEAEATFVFPGSEPITLTQDQSLGLRNRSLKVVRILETEVLLQNNGAIYSAKLTEAGSRSIISGASLKSTNDTLFKPDGSGDIGKPRDPRDVTGLPEAARKKIEEMGGDPSANPPANDAYTPIYWEIPQANFESKWKHIISLFDTKAHLVAELDDKGAFVGTKIAAFHPMEEKPAGEKDGEEDSAEKIKLELLEALEYYGFSIGDVITQVEDTMTPGPLEFMRVIRSVRYQDGIEFWIERNGREQLISLIPAKN